MSTEITNENQGVNTAQTVQLCSFIIGDGFYGVPVLEVQEIIKPQAVTPVPLADKFVRGLINLRGQIVTAISLRNLFGLEENIESEHMNVIVRSKDSLYSLVVDQICDVITVERSSFSSPPETLNSTEKEYIDGVYKLDGQLLISLNLDKILNKSNIEN